MNVLVACEESQRVTIEFRKLGHNAYSCDLLECSGNHPEWHIKKDVTLLLNGNCIFNTVDGVEHEISGKWDMIIAFPPCTYLTVTGNRWYNYEKYGDKAIQRMLDRNDAIKFFMTIANADCDKIAIENPVGIMSTQWRKPDQIIQPYQYGDAYEKRTCLWLKGLPMLSPTKIVEIPGRIQFKSGKTMAKWYVEAGNLSKEQRALVRSKTFPGIAKAMATQWGSEESIKDTIMTDDCIKTVLNMEELFSQMFGNTIRSKCKMYNNSCYGCPADRQGNRCGGEQWCKQTWKRYGAIVNPEWHHVSLATLANIDNDMLDEKRRHYMKVYRMTANVINSIYKCNKLTSIDKLRTNLIQTVRTMAKNEKIEWALVQYVKAKIDNCYLVNGLQSSFYSKTYGYNKSRSYTKTFFI